MCGIIGYIGGRDAAPVLLDGLRRLEYRGYDSAGMALLNGHLRVRRAVGEVSCLEASVNGQPLDGHAGIAHTRWATHGAATTENAHPHVDCFGKVAVVHNGVIENHAELRDRLTQDGHHFRSETDTEVFAHLIESHFTGDLESAVRSAATEIAGSCAAVVVSEHQPDLLVAVRLSSPLVVGLGEGENWIASDLAAIAHQTRTAFILEDHEIAAVRAGSVEIRRLDGEKVCRSIFHVSWHADEVQRLGYDEFMLKEIHEQPTALRNLLVGKLGAEGLFQLEEAKLAHKLARTVQKVWLVGCGTAYHAALAVRPAMEKWAGVPVEVDIASEFRYREPKVGPDHLVIAVSQSGETADTLAALREAARLGAVTLAITNVEGSTLSRESERTILTKAGPEIAVASTKGYVTQVTALAILAASLGQMRGSLQEPADELQRVFAYLPEAIHQVLIAHEDRIRKLSLAWKTRENALFIGRGGDYPTALEGQLKLKEVSYVHAEAVPAGELKHGTLALVGAGFPVVAVASQPRLYEKMASNVQEVKARGAETLGIVSVGGEAVASVVDHVIFVPRVHPLLAPVVSVVPLQLFAYYMAKARGCNVDRPRNLAKSVTVE